jgi:hypothetical protein
MLYFIFKVSQFHSYSEEKPSDSLEGSQHVLGFHHPTSWDDTSSLLPVWWSRCSWWLPTHEWLWQSHLQDGQWQEWICVLQIPFQGDVHCIFKVNMCNATRFYLIIERSTFMYMYMNECCSLIGQLHSLDWSRHQEYLPRWSWETGWLWSWLCKQRSVWVYC